MPDYRTIEEYLSVIEEQIRWKRARSVLSMELRRHMEDQRDAFIKEGFEDAERMAVEEMGGPAEVGIELDRIHRPKPQWGLLGMTVVLALTGGFLRSYLSPNFVPGRTVLAVVLGIAALLGGYFLDCSRLLCRPKTVYLTALAAAISYRLIYYYLIFPSHFSKMYYYAHYITQLYPVVYAVWLYNWRGRGWKGFFMALAGGIPLAAICLTFSLSNVLTLLISGCILLLFAVYWDWFRVSKPLAITFLVGIALVFASWTLLRYGRSERLLAVFHPELYVESTGFYGTAVRSLLKASQQLGEATAASGTLYLERRVLEGNGDFLLTALVYRLGWIPFLLLVMATAVLAAWMISKCFRQRAGNMLALSVAMIFVCRIAVSVMVNMGFVLCSAAFPLLTGNLQSIIDMGLTGLALSVFRGGSLLRERELGQKTVSIV